MDNHRHYLQDNDRALVSHSASGRGTKFYLDKHNQHRRLNASATLNVDTPNSTFMPQESRDARKMAPRMMP